MTQNEAHSTTTEQESPEARKRPRSKWRPVDRWMRWLHLYTGLFLFPWMLVYCASAFCLNHGTLMPELLGVKKAEFKVERRVDLPGDKSFSGEPAAQAKALLEYLDLDGAHFVAAPRCNEAQLVVIRRSGSGTWEITWRRKEAEVIVKKQQPFSWYRLMNFLHFSGGYRQSYTANILWAIVVDAVAISIALWCLTGIYLWARRPRRLLGGICVVAGSLLFMGLVMALCS